MFCLGSLNVYEPGVNFDFAWRVENLVTLALFALSSDSSRKFRCRMTGLWADVMSWLLANNFGFDFSCLRSNDFDKFSSKSDSSGLKGRFDSAFRKTKCSGIFSWYNAAWGQACFHEISAPMFNICPYVFRLMHNSLFRVSGFMALAIAKLLANGYVVGHRAPPIRDSWLTIVEAGNMRLVIDLRNVINYFVKLFSLISTNLIGNPCT